MTYEDFSFKLGLKATGLFDHVRWLLWHKHTRAAFSRQTYAVAGRDYRYFVHHYNRTWANERAVEIPIAWDLVKQHQGKRVLEIGNVLSHYFQISHDVVDRYEHSKRYSVLNEDILHFAPSQKYDLIVSISTFEHIGYDEHPKEPGKVFRAFEKIRELLAPDGVAAIGFPAGYNPVLDDAVRNGKVVFDKTLCLQRSSQLNEWKPVALATALDCKYGEPYPYANGIVFAFIYPLASPRSQ